jgi:phosphatidate phosphatase APP1
MPEMAFLRRIWRAAVRFLQRLSLPARSFFSRRRDERPLVITAYRGYGRRDYIFLQGRILRYAPLYGVDHNSYFKNLIDSYRRFGVDEVADAELRISIDDNHFEVSTDKEGYFILDHPLGRPLSVDGVSGWRPALVHLRRVPWREADLRAHAHFIIPPESAAFGVISDIDDTILQTHVTSLLKLKTIFYTLFKNAAGRRAFGQVAAFCRALQAGEGGERYNPFFYVSNSPWNLYDLLRDFMAINRLPKGPLLLRDIRLVRDRARRYQPGHKYLSIRRLLHAFPQLPFILIGDSGERDADIYLSIAREFPERIRAIYIHDVRSPRRARRIAALIRQTTHVDIRLVHNYLEAARDAAGKGLLDFQRFEAYRRELG